MELNTKRVNEIYVDSKKHSQMAFDEKKKEIQKVALKFNKLFEEIGVIQEKNWIEMENVPIYYNFEHNLLIPNHYMYEITKTNLNEAYKEVKGMYKFAGLQGKLMNYKQAKDICSSDTESPYHGVFRYVTYKDTSGIESIENTDSHNIITRRFKNSNTELGGFFNSIQQANTVTSNNRYSYNIPVYNIEGEIPLDEVFIKYNLIPRDLSGHGIKLFKELRSLYVRGYINLGSKNIFKESFIQAVLNNEIELPEDMAAIINSATNSTQESELKCSEEIRVEVCKELLNCDKVRADIEAYDMKILEDINRGHWELWNVSPELSKVHMKVDGNLIARNPIADIKKGGVIGIDFGTKSTIVVSQENTAKIMPMRVGMGRFGKKVSVNHYENPTVMEFRDSTTFLREYYSKRGRPQTKWEDLTVSHTAFNNMLASESSKYYAFMDDLKQWAGNKERSIKIIDNKTSTENILKPYLELELGDLDPIEIYAYYLGLYINNMHNGIFLEYILSFPVTYEKAIRHRIIESFTKGLKKSLPKEVLEDIDTMKQFKVLEGASEPAAYAVCALQEYGFEPEEDEEVFYGVFDFGGGTTDFDFGVWKEADASERRYDYEIQHFGAGGDKYLGGENLLELMAFEIFKANQDQLRQEGIPFLLPPECERFAGSETLISSSQEAKLNVKQLKEKIRPLWERSEGYESLYKNGILKVNLYDRDGKCKMNFELEVNLEKLEGVLKKRIEKGVQNFFEALKLTFNRDNVKQMKQVVIFLAGNSSRSQILLDIFKKHIEERTNYLRELTNTNEDFFILYPPLGTKQAYEILADKHIEIDETDIARPTGKTGVAFGLLQCRKGGRIKVVSEDVKSSDEIQFQYYIGYERKRYFRVSIDKLADYNVWHNYVDASESIFEIYYTDLPQATTNKLAINEGIKKLRLSTEIENVDANIYIRLVSPTAIEYVVATEQGINVEDYLSDIKKVQLD
ncbi:MAG: hypothetical protein Q4F66_05885 [Clostridium sp.]|nr:hypothetical protein [Clostridium sp.]